MIDIVKNAERLDTDFLSLKCHFRAFSWPRSLSRPVQGDLSKTNWFQISKLLLSKLSPLEAPQTLQNNDKTIQGAGFELGGNFPKVPGPGADVGGGQTSFYSCPFPFLFILFIIFSVHWNFPNLILPIRRWRMSTKMIVHHGFRISLQIATYRILSFRLQKKNLHAYFFRQIKSFMLLDDASRERHIPNVYFTNKVHWICIIMCIMCISHIKSTECVSLGLVE